MAPFRRLVSVTWTVDGTPQTKRGYLRLGNTGLYYLHTPGERGYCVIDPRKIVRKTRKVVA